MTMKSLILLLVLIQSIIFVVKSEDQWRVELLSPQGFRILMQHPVSFTKSAIRGDIWYKPYGDAHNDWYDGEMTRQSDGWWIYQNLTTTLNPGDKIAFGIGNFREGRTDPELEDVVMGRYVVPDDVTRVSV